MPPLPTLDHRAYYLGLGGNQHSRRCDGGRWGLQIMALETKRMGCFFVPSLGPAPRWCSFMENLTEELEEETQAAVYDDYHFVTKEELDKCALPPPPA
jgi:hypothetical protein